MATFYKRMGKWGSMDKTFIHKHQKYQNKMHNVAETERLIEVGQFVVSKDYTQRIT